MKFALLSSYEWPRQKNTALCIAKMLRNVCLFVWLQLFFSERQLIRVSVQLAILCSTSILRHECWTVLSICLFKSLSLWNVNSWCVCRLLYFANSASQGIQFINRNDSMLGLLLQFC